MTTLPSTRYKGAALTVDDNIYYFGGAANVNYPSYGHGEIYKYDINSDIWTTRAPMMDNLPC